MDTKVSAKDRKTGKHDSKATGTLRANNTMSAIKEKVHKGQPDKHAYGDPGLDQHRQHYNNMVEAKKRAGFEYNSKTQKWDVK